MIDDSGGVKHYTFGELVRSGGKHSGKFSIKHEGDKIIVTGIIGGVVTLAPGETLGYEDGKVWPSPKDPIKRFIVEDC